MTRARAAVWLVASLISATLSLEWVWVSADRDIAGSAALPAGVALALVTMIVLVGAWVLPWWARIIAAVGGVVSAVLVLVQGISVILNPSSAPGVSGDATTALGGPSMMALSLAMAMRGFWAVARNAQAWPGLSSRYQPHDVDPWRAMDRGLDPTDDE